MKNVKSYLSCHTLIFNGIKHEGKESLLSLAQLLLNEKDEEKNHIGRFLIDWLKEDETIELQTSGSTGTPKIIRVHKNAMIASAQRTLKFLELKPDSSALLCLSARYIAGKMMLVRALVGHLRLFTSPVSGIPLKSLHRRFDFVAMVPMQVIKILNENKEALNNIHHLIIGGGSVNTQVSAQLKELTTRSWETYGMTETVSHIALRSIKDAYASFIVLPGLSVTTDDRDCLVVEPSDVNEERLVTNDIVELKSDKEFVLKGRFDNIINTGGVKVMAEEIERKLCAILSIPFAVSWKTDDILGQKVVLVCESLKPLSLSDVDWTLLAKYELPKEIICIDEIPKTETGKIQREKLQQLIDK
ncbi:AMP-binding protein [Carboxylicivirga sp. RSCT41]|uniref:AMP-binding protein n=1 Tax=Carboxylicivirga agarovorans TaxID=3417570 RepID=UPI003D3327A4